MSTPPPPPPPPGNEPLPPWGSAQPPAGYVAYGQAGASQNHPKGTTVLVLGILSLIICGIILGPIAWIMGNSAMSEIKASPQVNWTNRGSVNAGRICGIIGTCLSVLILIIVIAGRS
jgi:hypothetical protein